ncbi:MAG: hypothetical protein JNJ71_13220 [Rubrivivax sp.]|nr:hypothetical protein [Rubrivivax sp.]
MTRIALTQALQRLRQHPLTQLPLSVPREYAYRQPLLQARLRAGPHHDTRRFLEEHDRSLARDIHRVWSSRVAATFSPRRTMLDEAYYVDSPSLSRLDILIPERGEPIAHSHVALVGCKGSGKTTTQNHWLRLQHTRLEEQGVLYMRCDATKLFDYWQHRCVNMDGILKAEIPNYLPTIEEFFHFQLVYVLSKHCEHGLLAEVIEGLSGERVTFPFQISRSIEDPVHVQKSVSEFLQGPVRTSIQNFEGTHPDRCYFVHSLFKEAHTRRREYRRWQNCATVIERWLHKKGYRLLKILDGVDNLHLNTDAGERLYHAFLPQVQSFCLRRGNSNEIRLTVMRRRTQLDLRRHDPLIEGSEPVAVLEVIDHVPPDGQEVIDKRLQFFGQQFQSPHSHEVLAAATAAMPPSSLLHDNQRHYIAGAANLALLARFRWHQLNKHADYLQQCKLLMRRNLFLAARLYLRTEEEYGDLNSEQGVHTINPFWFPASRYSNRYRDPLFLRVRLLELLDQTTLNHEEVVHLMSTDWNYDPSAVDQAISDSRAFGWIDTTAELGTFDSRMLAVSDLGHYLLHELLADVDVLYMLALDVRLPKAWFTKGLVAVHNNHLIERTGYSGAATVTVGLFVSWLCNLLQADRVALAVTAQTEVWRKGVFLSPAKLRKMARTLKDRWEHAAEVDREVLEIFASAMDLPDFEGS